MIIYEILFPCCESVYVDQDGEVLSEAAIRQFKRVGHTIIKKYRCTAGTKKGKLVSDPSKCGQRKDPIRVRQGRKLMRSKKGIIARKSKISKRKAMSKMVTKMNDRLAGN
jgi:hypothetical protein